MTDQLLTIEPTAVVDFGEEFVEATYCLEGDGPLAVECYEIITTLKAAIQTGYHPNVEAVTSSLRGYLTKASQLRSTSNFCLLVWWKNNETNLPHWS